MKALSEIMHDAMEKWRAEDIPQRISAVLTDEMADALIARVSILSALEGFQWPAVREDIAANRHSPEDLAFLREKGFTGTADELVRLHKIEDAVARDRAPTR